MGAHNALSAKLVEESGFDAVWASGMEISTSYALPDANILTDLPPLLVPPLKLEFRMIQTVVA